MKVGDLVKYRHPVTDDEKAIAIVFEEAASCGTFLILELSGQYSGSCIRASSDMWEVISEGG